MLDFPLMAQVKLPVVDRIQPQSDQFATGVENKATGDSGQRGRQYCPHSQSICPVPVPLRNPHLCYTLTLILDQESVPVVPTSLSKSASSCPAHLALPLLFSEARNLSSKDSYRSYPIKCQAIREVQVNNNQVLYATAIQECSTYRPESYLYPINLHIVNTEVESVCFFDTNQGNDVVIIGVERNSPDVIRVCEQQECFWYCKIWNAKQVINFTSVNHTEWSNQEHSRLAD